jgi:adenylate cyclase class 2
MEAAEIELKFPVHDPVALSLRLETLGFRLETPRSFESNTLYDTADRSLRAMRQILRVRHYAGRWTVTHKRQLDGDTTPARYKVRLETETTVEDGASMGALLQQIGYGPVFRYEKFRTEWSDPSVPDGHLVLDETAIGTFVELEGPTAWIDLTLERLEVSPEHCLTESYGKLFLLWKERTGSPAEHLTFEEIRAGAAV